MANKTPQIVACFVLSLMTAFAGCLIFSKVFRDPSPVHAIRPSLPGAAYERGTTDSRPGGLSTSGAASSSEPNSTTTEQTSSSSDDDGQPAPESAGSGALSVAIAGTSAHHPETSPAVDGKAGTASSDKPNVGKVEQTRTAPRPPHSPSTTVERVPLQVAPFQAPEGHQQRNEQPSKPEVPAAGSDVGVVTVPRGTLLRVRLSESLSSKQNRSGDTFRATLVSSLLVNGVVVSNADSSVLGRVALVRRGGVLGGSSDLTITLTHLTMADESTVPIKSSICEVQGSHNNLLNSARMATGAAFGAVMGAVAGAEEGAGITSASTAGGRRITSSATKRTAMLPAGTLIGFSLDSPVTIPQTVLAHADH